MLQLPFCLVDYILKLNGAYTLNKEDRPYILELHAIQHILPAHGVRAAIVHLKEWYVLQKSYCQYPRSTNPLYGLYSDAHHLL